MSSFYYKKKQVGFSIPIGLFLLVIVGLLSATLLNITQLGHEKKALNANHLKAYFAAKTGLEFGKQMAARSTCAPNSSLSLPNGFTVNINCSQVSARESDVDVVFFNIEAVSCNNAVCPFIGTPPLFYTESKLRGVITFN